MKNLIVNKSVQTVLGKCNSVATTFIIVLSLSLNGTLSPVSAQSVLFDFDNAPLLTSLPISLTVGGITAHFSATGQGYSIQDNTAPVVPQGFTGRFIYTNSIYLSDLLISFDHTINNFSIWYSPQELACDTSATMRVTAYTNGNYVGTNTKIAATPGTWPVDSLSCSFAQGFDSVVVHFDSHPSLCQDWGPIFLADNMRVTPISLTNISKPQTFLEGLTIPNPVSPFTTISFSVIQSQDIKLNIYDMTGRLVKSLFDGLMNTGENEIIWDTHEFSVVNGLYILNITGENFSLTHKLVVAK
jgi:hypothetical protein